MSQPVTSYVNLIGINNLYLILDFLIRYFVIFLYIIHHGQILVLKKKVDFLDSNPNLSNMKIFCKYELIFLPSILYIFYIKTKIRGQSAS